MPAQSSAQKQSADQSVPRQEELSLASLRLASSSSSKPFAAPPLRPCCSREIPNFNVELSLTVLSCLQSDFRWFRRPLNGERNAFNSNFSTRQACLSCCAVNGTHKTCV